MHTSLAALIHAAGNASLGAASTPSKSSNGGYGLLVVLAGGLLLFYLMSRPARRRQRLQIQQRREQLNTLEVGTQVLTKAGMYAHVAELPGEDDDNVVLEIAPGFNATFKRDAILEIIRPESETLYDEAAIGHEAIDPESVAPEPVSTEPSTESVTPEPVDEDNEEV